MRSEMHLPGYFSLPDLRENARWPLHPPHGTFTQCYDLSSFSKEQLRQTILKHESMFRHQVYELHRLYKVQREIASELKASQYSFSSMKGSSWQSGCLRTPDKLRMLEESESFESKRRKLQRRLFDLEVPTDKYLEDGYGIQEVSLKFQTYDDERARNSLFHSLETAQSGCVGSFFSHPEHSDTMSNCANSLKPSLKMKIFGTEISQVDGFRHNPVFSQEKSNVGVCDHSSSVQSFRFSSKMNGYSVFRPIARIDRFPELHEKKESSSVIPLKGAESRRLEAGDDGSSTKKIFGFTINLQESCELKVCKSDSPEPASPKSEEQCRLRACIDLNLSVEDFEEEEGDRSDPCCHKLGFRAAEIDLEKPIVMETEAIESLEAKSDRRNKISDGNSQDELIIAAAGALVSISSSTSMNSHAINADKLDATLSNPLLWFAELIFSLNEVLEGTDEFEYAKLSLAKTKDEDKHNHDFPTDEGLTVENFVKRRRGRGRPKKDLQCNVLGSVACVTRNEASCDLETIRRLVEAAGGSAQGRKRPRGSGSDEMVVGASLRSGGGGKKNQKGWEKKNKGVRTLL